MLHSSSALALMSKRLESVVLTVEVYLHHLLMLAVVQLAAVQALANYSDAVVRD